MALNDHYGLGRVCRKLPPHHNVKELGDNIETLANYFLDRGCRNALSANPGPFSWEWHLGPDRKWVVHFLRGFVDDDIYTNKPRAKG